MCFWYETGNDQPLDRNGAISAGKEGTLKCIVEADTTHPGLHFSIDVTSRIVDFFDITLRQIAAQRGAAVSFKERIEIARTLDRLRLDAIELPPIADQRR